MKRATRQHVYDLATKINNNLAFARQTWRIGISTTKQYVDIERATVEQLEAHTCIGPLARHLSTRQAISYLNAFYDGIFLFVTKQ